MDWQFLVVLAAVVIAGGYAAHRVRLQFERPDDEREGCHGCPANSARRRPVKEANHGN
jgi:hypothetical protein